MLRNIFGMGGAIAALSVALGEDVAGIPLRGDHLSARNPMKGYRDTGATVPHYHSRMPVKTKNGIVHRAGHTKSPIYTLRSRGRSYAGHGINARKIARNGS